MRRGSTPINVFFLDLDLSGATVYISYEQGKRVLVEKTNEDMTFSTDGDKFVITVTLTQEETLRFKSGEILIQCRYVTPTGEADASNIIRADIERILKDGVITYVV